MQSNTQLFFLDKRSQFHLDTISKISSDQPEARLIVVDVGAFDYPLQAPWRVPAIFGSGSKSISKMFETLGVEYVDASRITPIAHSWSPDEQRKMDLAVKSTMISWFRRRSGPERMPGVLDKFVQRLITSQSRRVFRLSIDLIEKYAPSKVYIENGRFAVSHSSYLAALRLGCEIVFPEIQSDTRRLYLRDYRVHDRVAMQKHAMDITAGIPRSEISAHSDNWIAEWRPQNSKLNPFTNLWTAPENSWKGPRESLALFATSSSDETASLDLNWEQASWETQLVAFQAVWDKIKPRGLSPVLRVHPNLLNKHPMAAIQEIRAIREFKRSNPEFVIVWASSPVSTYELMSYSSIVIVHNSTVGLEACLDGIPVICTNSCYFDLISDVTSVFSPHDLSKIDDISPVADRFGAQRFIAALEVSNETVPPNSNGVDISNASRYRLLPESIRTGAIFSIVFEKRWQLYRRIVSWLSPS